MESIVVDEFEVFQIEKGTLFLKDRIVEKRLVTLSDGKVRF